MFLFVLLTSLGSAARFLAMYMSFQMLFVPVDLLNPSLVVVWLVVTGFHLLLIVLLRGRCYLLRQLMLQNQILKAGWDQRRYRYLEYLSQLPLSVSMQCRRYMLVFQFHLLQLGLSCLC